MSRVALITASSEFERWVRAALGATTTEDDLRRWREEYLRIDPSKVVAEMADDGIDVVCLGPGLDLDAVFELAGAFDREHPEICVLVVAEPTPAVWERAVQAGVRDVLPAKSTRAMFSKSVTRALETADRRRANLLGGSETTSTASRVVCVLSPKGGSGKTTVATNLAVAIARATPGMVAIVDLDLQFGDLASALQLRPEHSMTDVARSPEAVDATMLKVFLAHHPSSLYTLCAPESPVDAEEVTADDAARVIGLLASEFPVVLIDTAAGLDESTLAAIELATDLVFLCSTDVASVRSLRKELDALQRLNLLGKRHHFVLNRADAQVGLEVKDIEMVIGMKIDAAVPSSRSVPVSLNRGIPLAESDPRSPLVKQLQPLIERLVGRTDAEAHPPASGPGRFRRRKEGS